MSELNNPIDSKNSLRKRAEESLSNASGNISANENTDVRRLLHELQVHKIELEMQNEDLRNNLAQGEDRYTCIVENLTEFVDRYLPGGILTYVNPALQKYAGLPAEALLGESFYPFIHEADRDKTVRIIESISIENPVVESESRVKLPDGRLCWNSWTHTGIFDESETLIEYQSVGRDITERKQAEAELYFHSNIFTNLTEGICLVSIDSGTIVYSNSRFEMLFGYESGEMIGKDVACLNAAGNMSAYEMKSSIMGNLSQHGEWHGEVENIKKDGTHFWCYANVSMFDHHEYGKVFISVHSDITGIKQAEKDLHRLVSRISVGVYVLHTTPDGIFSLDYASPRMSELVSCSVETLLSDSQSWFTNIHPDDLDGFVKTNQEGIARLRLFDWTGRLLVEGIVRWLHIQSSPEKQMDGGVLWHGVVTDITESKRAEEKLRDSQLLLESIVENIPFMIFLKEAQDLKFVLFNRAGEELLGYDRHALLGKSNLELFPPEQAAHFMAKDREALEAKSGVVDIPEEPILTARNSLRLLHTQKVCIRGVDGSIKYLLGVSEDITERKRIERELQLKNAEIEQFIYNASHDLRSPLVTIQTFMGYLEQDISKGDNDRIVKDVDYIKAATSRMESLLNEILEIARVGSSSTIAETVPFQTLVSDALDAVAGQISGSRTNVQVNVGNLVLCGDRRRLLQVWQNLLDNSLKYIGGQAAPFIEIGVEQKDGDLCFFVRDNGIGIAPEDRYRVFGLLEKLDRSSSGIGMGLAMVRRIVELYGGRIWVESDGIGTGSCFYFTLPKAVVQ